MKRHVSDSATPKPDLSDIRAFCLVADHGSITSAARTLGETKGSVSRRLTRLERELGVTLLRRTPRLVQPTEDGVIYRMRMGRLLELLDEAHAEVQHASQVPAGHLRVTAPYDLATGIFAPHFARFVETHDGISLELLLTDAMLDFDAYQIDVALRASVALQDSSLVGFKLVEIEGRLFASPRYLDVAGRPRAPAELARHRMLLVHTNRGSTALLLTKAGTTRPHHVQVRAAVAASDFGFCRDVAVEGAGIAVLPTLVAQRDVKGGSLVPVLEDYSVFRAAVYLLYPGARFLAPKVRVFRDHMLDAFAKKR